jgi:hypothetical protein
MTWKKWNVGYETCVQTNTLIGGISEAGFVPADIFMTHSDRQDMLEGVPAYSCLKTYIC